MANLKCNGTIEASSVIVNGSNVLTLENYLNKVYPVGAIYMSVNNTNPQSLFGGTWVAWGAGRVPLGIGSNGETNYTTPEATGGSENSVASHTHAQNAHTHTVQSKTLTGQFISRAPTDEQQSYVSGGIVNYIDGSSGSPSSGSAGGKTYLGIDATHNHTLNSTTATNQSQGTTGGNRQPYITCYMWKRTA